MRTDNYMIAIALLALLACSRSAQVAEPGGASSAGTDVDDNGADDDGLTDGGGEDSGDDEVKFPKFRFIGTGHISCNGGTVGTATATLYTEVDKDMMKLVTEKASFTCAPNVDQCNQAEAASKTQNSTGTNTYKRVSDDEMEVFEREDDVINGRFAVFAAAVTSTPTSGAVATTTFDKPLPVFPYPSPKTRFKPVEDVATWTAHASGSESVDVTMTMKMIVGNDNVVAIETNVDMPPAAYAKFPIPKRAIYRIDPRTRRVTQIEVTKVFRGQKRCEEGEAYMDFKICQATQDGEVEDIIPCQ